jgi:septal ring factor EnvC (AmiA/AmiB activator)
MTDANVISIAITLFAIAAGSLFNNVRISDTATATNKRIDDMRDFIHSENARLDQKLDRIAETLSMLNDHEQRIRGIEHRPH